MVKNYDFAKIAPDILQQLPGSITDKSSVVTDGTTILACKYDGGIMLAADGRSASSMFVHNSCSDKLEPLHQRIYAQRSGTSAHTSTIAKYVRYYIDVQANELGDFPPVRSAAGVMREIIYNNRNSLSASMICSGWDPYEGFQIYTVNQSGFQTEGEYGVGGSGSVFVAGYMDAFFKPNMSRVAVKEFMKQCIALACYRDGNSGGCCRLLDIQQDKVEREFHEYSTFSIQ